jgi:hypothetical protein
MADAYSGSVDPTEAAGTFEGDGTETTMVGSSATALSTFDDDAGEKRPKKSETTTNQTRAQARANAHHIQKFVNQQGACWADLPLLLGAKRTGELCGVLSQFSARRL